MYIHGSFVNKLGDIISVHIVTNADRTDSVEVGNESDGLFFTDDPVEIRSDVNDTFDHLLRQSASIRLLTRDFISDFFRASCRDAVVNIYRGDVCLFAGFIEPQAYSQPYNDVYDEVELNCVDALSALQYSKYKNIGSPGISYHSVKSSAGMRTLHDITVEILNGVSDGLDIAGGHPIRYLYDGSKAIDGQSYNRHTIFKQLALYELLFLGDGEDDVWQQDEVLEEMLRYLNLHIVQDGFTFYVFSWETARSSSPISWRDLVDGQTTTTDRKEVVIEASIAADCGTTISIGEVYNQLLLTCDVKEIESVIENPLSDSSLVSPYTNKQKYCTEYSADGNGLSAYNAFYTMTHDGKTNYGAGSVVDWFVHVMRNPQWTFPMFGNESNDLISVFCKDNASQQALPNWLGQNPGAAIIGLGSVEMNTANDDNSPTSKVNMTNYLVVSVNGNGKDSKDDCYPSASDIKSSIPYAVYNGNEVGGAFSPSDDDTTNYIVLSGSIVLNPLMDMTGTYRALHDEIGWNEGLLQKYWHKTVPSRTNGDGRYYTRQYWKSGTPSDDAVWDPDTDYGLVPFTGKGPEQYEFKYSSIGESSDTVSKIAVLACMLIIGDKCVVETGSDGQTSDFEWRKYKTLEECGDEDEYYQQCFTIGFDPKIGDKLIGTEFAMQNNISYTMGIDAEGIAIPIKKSDKVSGRVKFMILGPVNTMLWGEIAKRQPTFFRGLPFGKDVIPLLAHVSNILVKQFEVKLYSDNGFLSNSDDSDIVYMSDTQDGFTNKKDDLEFKINSALTTSECKDLGVANTAKLSTPVSTDTGDALLSIYDYSSGSQAKPEQIYVDSYYREYHLPRVLMSQKLMDADGVVGLFHHYLHPALGKLFFVQGISRNLMEGYADLTIKEIGS